MSKPIYIILLLFVTSPILQAKDSIFNTIFLKVATDLTYKDPDRAIHISDSLFTHSTDRLHKLSALMLSANVYYRKGNLKQALQYGQKAENIAKTIKDYDWLVRIHGFYSSIYRDIRFIDEGLAHLEIVDALSPKVKDKGKRNVIDILNTQSKAYFHLLNNNPDAALDQLNQGVPLYSDLENSSVGPYHIGNSEEFRGRMFLLNKEYEKSAEAYQNALSALRKIDLEETYPVYGYIYSGIGQLQVQKDSLDAAKTYLDKAQAIAALNKNTDLSLFYNKYLQSYHSKRKNWEDYAATADTIKFLEKKVENEVSLLLQNLFGEIQEKKDRDKAKVQNYKAIIFIGMGVIGGLLLFSYKRKKRHKLYVDSILEKIETLNVAKPSTVKKSKKKSENAETIKLNISEDTLHRIKESLNEFEQDTLFLDPSINAASIASYCQTNVRYLSYVINTYRNESVSAYINRLRVTYILSKLKNDPTYRTYKISHLADEAGFSSHSKFSSEFKRVVGISPSIFISKLS